MASFPDLRHRNLSSDSTEGSRTFRNTKPAAAAALLLAAVAVFVTVSELATHHGATKATPAFLTRALGVPQAAAPLVRKPAPHVTVTTLDSGLVVFPSATSLYGSAM